MSDHGQVSAETRAILDALRVAAGERLADAERLLQTVRHEQSASENDDEHDPDGVPLSFEWSRASAMVAAANREIQEIDAALVRVDAGVYGRCETCGHQIEAARLHARPFVTTCIGCARIRDARR